MGIKNPRVSSIIIQIAKRWFCCQRNTLSWDIQNEVSDSFRTSFKRSINLGRWKCGCILPCTEAGGKTEVVFQRTYSYSQRKVKKTRLSHLQQQHQLRRSFEVWWSSKIKTGSKYQRYCSISESFHLKRNPYISPFKWNYIWWHYRWRNSNSRAINSIVHSFCCWSRP